MPTQEFIESILKEITKIKDKAVSVDEYRCGPVVNKPLTVAEEICSYKKKWGFCLVSFDWSFVIFDDDENLAILEELQKPKWDGHLTGEVIEAFINSKKDEAI